MTLLLFYCFLTSLSLAHGASTIHISPTQPPTDSEKTIWENSTRKFIVAETPLYGPPTYNNPQVIGDVSVALAAQRTFRKDPLNGFQIYTGGWNISSRHYWASVGYTAVPLFAVATVWFLGFGICLLVICMCHICHRSQSIGYSRVAYILSLIFLLFFTLMAIIGCVMLYSGQIRYNKSTTETLAYVMSQADSTVSQLKAISDYLTSAEQIRVLQVSLPANVQTEIDQIGAKLTSSIATITDKATSSSNDIRNFLNSVRVALIVVSIVMLILTFLGLASSIFGMQVIVYTLVILGWILVAGTFILSGTFLLLHNATADTCVAMSEWVERPASNTALDEILPCTDNATAQETLMRSKEVTGQLVELINTVVSNVSNINFSPVFPQMYYNQSGPLLPLLCNPFNHDLTGSSSSFSFSDRFAVAEMTKLRKLGRHTGHRMSMLRTLVSQLVKHERIETTITKAKEVRRLADNMVQLGKEGSLDAARRAAGFVRGDDVIHKIFTEFAYRYKDRAGGYTRMLRTRIRVGDAAPMAYIEFIDRENELRQSNPPTPQPPQRVPLDPWARSRLMRQYAPPKEEKNSDSDL